MRLKSEYHLTCAACGAAIVTADKTGRCPACGVEYEIQWAAEYVPKQEKHRGPE
jgi:rubrerythrin